MDTKLIIKDQMEELKTESNPEKLKVAIKRYIA